ncbi:putative Heat shock factor binding 1 [Helianthus debilis subsp. tardiflorus]
MDGKDSGDGKQNTADMTQFVQTLLQQMQNRFQTMSDSIVSKNILFAYMFIKIVLSKYCEK